MARMATYGAWCVGLALSLLLSGCGKVVGALGDTLALTNKTTRYSLSTSSLDCEVQAGEQCDEILVMASVDGSGNTRPAVEVVPAAGSPLALQPSAPADLQTDGRWRLKLQMLRDLPPGVYKGELQVTPFDPDHLKQTNPASRLSYQLTVKGLVGELRPLKSLPSAARWQGFAANAAHNAVIDARLDVSRFSHRWTVMSKGFGVDTSAPVAANGRIYLQNSEVVGNKGQHSLLSYDENDAKLLWRYDAPDQRRLDAPATDGSRLLVLEQPGSLLSFDALSGVMQNTYTGLELALDNLLPPTLADGRAYFRLGATLHSADAVSTLAYWNAGLGLTEPDVPYTWAPTIGRDFAYVNAGGRIEAYRLSDGVRAFTVELPVPTPVRRNTQYGAPVLVDELSLVALSNRLLDLNSPFQPQNSLSRIDLGTRKLRWSVNGIFSTQPVVAQGVIYVGNLESRQLEARNLDDGKLLWAWSLAAVEEDGLFGGEPVLSSNLIFVAGRRRTYAIDLNTHQEVWRYRASGQLAISSNGTLLVRTMDRGMSWLTAINLH